VTCDVAYLLRFWSWCRCLCYKPSGCRVYTWQTVTTEFTNLHTVAAYVTDNVWHWPRVSETQLWRTVLCPPGCHIHSISFAERQTDWNIAPVHKYSVWKYPVRGHLNCRRLHFLWHHTGHCDGTCIIWHCYACSVVELRTSRWIFGWQDKKANSLSCEDTHPADVGYVVSEQDIMTAKTYCRSILTGAANCIKGAQEQPRGVRVSWVWLCQQLVWMLCHKLIESEWV